MLRGDRGKLSYKLVVKKLFIVILYIHKPIPNMALIVTFSQFYLIN